MKNKFCIIMVLFGLLGSLFITSALTTNSPTFLLQNEGQYQVNTIPFNWIDITSTGTHLILSDDDYQMITIPFDFPFYGESFTSVNVSSNGFLTFVTGEYYPTDTGGSIPQTSFPYLVALYWTDLYPDDSYSGGGVYFQSFGNYLVIQYDHISTCCSGELAGDFEVVLHSSGEIQMFYDNISTTIGTIGVDSGNYMNYTTYSLTPPVNEVGIEFSISQGVTIISDTYYSESDSSYTLAWEVSGSVTVDYFEVFMDGVSQGTTTNSFMDLSISPPSSHNLTVVLHDTDATTYRDQIFLIMRVSLQQYFVQNIPFIWLDITSTGTHLSLDDDSYQTVSIPFSFPFYDDIFSEVAISSNGFLTFDTTTYPSDNYGEIPQSEFPYLIALFWRDLYPDDGYGGGGVYYESFGDYFVIQYHNISTCCSGNLVGNFEIILYSTGIIQIYYRNLVFIDGVIGVDKGDSEYYTTYPIIPPIEELGIEFSQGPGVAIISPPYYEEEETAYTLEWSPMGVTDVSHYEVFVDGISQGTTTSQSMIIPVSSPNSYNVTVLLYTTDSSYWNQIHLITLQPIVRGLYVGAYLTYEFQYHSAGSEYNKMIYNVEVIERISTYLWLINISYSYYVDTSVDPIETYSSTGELDAAFLSSNTIFWSNAHQKSLGDTIIGLGGTTTIIGEETIYVPEKDISFDCWEVEMPTGEEEEGYAYFCKVTGVFIALESPSYMSGRLIDFNYPFSQYNEPPSLNIREPDDGDTFDTGTIEVEVTASDDKPGLTVEVKLDDGSWEEMTEVREGRWEYTFVDVSDGEHKISVRVKDSEGLQVTESVSFQVGDIETSGTKDEQPTISPGFEIIFPIIALVSLFYSKKRRK